MSITVCEEIILLTVNDEGKLLRWSEELAVRAAVAGASLIDLAFRGRIDNDVKELFIVSKEPTGEAHLDMALKYLSGKGDRMPIQTAVYDVMEVAREVHATALQRLVDKGILAKTDESFLWVLKSRRYPPLSSVIQQEAKLRILSVLMSDDIPTSEDVALISLAYETRILELFMLRAEIERLSARIREVGNLELIAQAVSAVKIRLAMWPGALRAACTACAPSAPTWALDALVRTQCEVARARPSVSAVRGESNGRW